MKSDINLVCENYGKLRRRVREAAERACRNPEDVKIVAVSKTVEPERIMKAIECGITDFGENRVQELREKYDIINVSCKWHLVGHLQTNKVKYIIDKVSLIHSLDRMGLAVEMQKRAEKAGRILDALVQVNVSGENTKFGINPRDAFVFMREVSKLGNIRIRGLMTIAPEAQNTEDIRWVFAALRKLLIDIKEENIDNINMDYLSMGMSNDFEVAIEEGANIIRIGTALFGRR